MFIGTCPPFLETSPPEIPPISLASTCSVHFGGHSLCFLCSSQTLLTKFFFSPCTSNSPRSTYGGLACLEPSAVFVNPVFSLFSSRPFPEDVPEECFFLSFDSFSRGTRCALMSSCRNVHPLLTMTRDENLPKSRSHLAPR